MATSPGPEDADRVRRAVHRRAVAWLAGHRTRLDPDCAPPDGVLFARKALVEVALLVGLRARLDPEPLDPDHRALLDQLAEVAARPSYRELIAQDQPALLLYAGTYAALRLCGRDDPDLRHLVERAVAGRVATCLERVPYRYLDLLHTLDLCGVRHDLPGVAAALPFTTLCADPSVLGLTDRDGYAITHAVFYATDFGVRVPPWPAGFDLARALDLVDALLMLHRVRGNADLVAELVCARYCLGAHDGPELDRAWAFLAGTQEDDGRVAGPDGIVHPDLQRLDPVHRSWATGYHTTVVVALAALLAHSPYVVRVATPAPSAMDVTLIGTALRPAVVRLAERAASAPLDLAVPAAATAAEAARCLGEPMLVRPALAALVRRLDEAPQPGGRTGHDWRRYPADVLAELARGLAEGGLSCAGLDEFLTDLAAALATVDVLSRGAVAATVRLARSGCLRPESAATLLATAGPAGPPAVDGPAAEAAAQLIRCTGDDPTRLDVGGDWHAVAEHLAAALPEACREYQVATVALLVRALVLLGWQQHRVVRDAAEFLLLQQGPDGGFGHPACDDPDEATQVRDTWTRNSVAALQALRAIPDQTPGVGPSARG